MGWHSDDEKPLGKNNTIASLSFGVERKFLFRHKRTKQTSNENHANRRKTSPKLLIIDTVMPEGNEPFIDKFTDILC
jgi:hypothetical protein